MRTFLLLSSLWLAAALPAQDWTRDTAVAELRELVLTKRSMEEWPARDKAISAWLQRVRESGVGLGDHAFLVGVAQYFTKDYGGAATTLIAELERLDGGLPTGDFDTIVGRTLMAHGVRAIRADDFAAARAALPPAVELYSDPAMVYRAAGAALSAAEGDRAVALLDDWLARMFVDARLDAAARQVILRAIYAPRERARPAAAPRGGSLQPFTAKDLDGAEISLEGLKGKVVLVDFWATWCGPCIREMPNVVRAHREFRDRGFTVVGISLDQEPGQKRGGPILAPGPQSPTVAKIREMMDRLGMEWPVVYEGGYWDARLAKENGIGSIPATFLLDRTGKIRFTNLRGEDLARRVAELIEER